MVHHYKMKVKAKRLQSQGLQALFFTARGKSMLKVVIPMAVLLVIVLCKKIPVIGGKINVALVITGALALVLRGL